MGAAPSTMDPYSHQKTPGEPIYIRAMRSRQSGEYDTKFSDILAYRACVHAFDVLLLVVDGSGTVLLTAKEELYIQLLSPPSYHTSEWKRLVSAVSRRAHLSGCTPKHCICGRFVRLRSSCLRTQPKKWPYLCSFGNVMNLRTCRRS